MSMTELLHNHDAFVRVEEKGSHRVIMVDRPPGGSQPPETWETFYPLELIEHVLRVKGPAHLCDEIKRDEQPLYVQHRLHWDLLGFADRDAFAGKRVLDFGSGSGASSMVLARMLPADTEIVGVELMPEFAELAEHRARFYGVEDRVKFLLSPDANSLPDEIGTFDFIVLSAVFEHLLPAERRDLLPLLWSYLRINGILFLDQTPYRWFPVEMHTTGLPLINYFPDNAALAYARRFSKRVGGDETWANLLRRGIRGGTEGEIMEILNQRGREGISITPSRLGVRDHIDLWYQMSSGSRKPITKKLMMWGFRAFKKITGVTIVPTMSFAIKKIT